MQKLHIIDALGPFVEDDDSAIINWSKVKFSLLEKNGRLPLGVRNRIIKRFDLYTTRVAELGYDGISIDDLAHLVKLPIYNKRLQTLLHDYRLLYTELFKLAGQKGMKIFINTDYLFYNDDIRTYIKETKIKRRLFFQNILQTALQEFPQIDGVILRIGETDGTDVEDTFMSTLTLRSPKQANRLLRTILPVFERHNKLLIFRTWTVGAYQIGDLIWNQKTFDAVFASITSASLIISMKFGDTDFMRYLSLNPLFFNGPHQKIIELQTRREWEGMGTYPSFVGWDYKKYLDQLSDNETVVGIHVWCQTGGWAKNAWTNVTYLDNSSFWNELNTFVTIRLYQDNCSVEEAIRLFCSSYAIADVERFIELLELSEIAIKKGLYIESLAAEELYFRRTRVPTLLWLTWDQVLISPTFVYILKSLTPRSPAVLGDADDAYEATQKMLAVARAIKLDQHVIASLEFEVATFAVFLMLRRYIYGTTTATSVRAINQTIVAYRKHYPQHYTIPKLTLIKKRQKIPRRVLRLALRDSSMYRRRDRIILATSLIQRRVIYRYLRRSQSHLADQAMGVETLIR